MIICEGPDGAGKTTLIQQLSTELDLPVAPRVVSKDTEVMVDIGKWVEENLNAGFQHKIFDRHRLISESIYAPIMDRESDASFSQLNWLTRMMYQFYSIRPVIIYCLPPSEVVWDNVESDPDNRAIRDYIPSLYQAYVSRAAIDLNRPNTFLYDYTARTVDEDYRWMLGMLRRILENRLEGSKF